MSIERIDTLDLDFSPVIQGAEKTERTLNDLRNEIKSLKTTLGNTAIESDDFGKTLEELNQKQQELKEVTKLTKKSVDDLDGSYNALSRQMAELRKEWKATNDDARRDELGKQINEINNQLKEFDKTTGNYQRNVGNYTGGIIDAFAQLKQELKDTKNAILQAEEGTDEYFEKIKQAAEISQKLQDVNEFIKSSADDLGDHIENISGVMAGLTGSIQAVQGAMNLMGVESKVVEQAIAKLQGLMAITQGLKAIEGAVDPFKRLTTAIKLATAGMGGFQKALIGTGIGVFIVLLGTLIANWENVSKALGIANEEQERNNRLLEEGKVHIQNVIDERARLNGLMEEQGKSEKEIIQSNIEVYNQQLETTKKQIRTLEGWVNTGKKLSDDQKARLQQLYDDQKTLNNQIASERKKLTSLEKKEEQDALKAQEDANKKSVELAKKTQQEKIALMNIEIERKKILYGEDYTSSVQYISDMGKVYSEMEKLYKGDAVKLAEIENQKLKLRKQAVEESYKLLKTPDIKGVTVTTTVEPPKLQSILPPQDILDDETTRWEKFTQRLSGSWSNFMEQFNEMSLGEKVQFIGSQINQVGNSLNGLFDSLMQGMDKNNEEYKKLEIAKVITTTITGVATAIATAWQLGPIAGAIVGPINAAATLASGISSINNIKKGVLNGSSISNISNTPTQASKTALESLNQGVNYTNNINDSSIEESIKNQKVYVLESDISRTQKNVNVIESESTY